MYMQKYKKHIPDAEGGENNNKSLIDHQKLIVCIFLKKIKIYVQIPIYDYSFSLYYKLKYRERTIKQKQIPLNQ